MEDQFSEEFTLCNSKFQDKIKLVDILLSRQEYWIGVLS